MEVITNDKHKIQVEDWMISQSTELQSMKAKLNSNEPGDNKTFDNTPSFINCDAKIFEVMKEWCYYHHFDASNKDISADDVAKWEYKFFKDLVGKNTLFDAAGVALDLDFNDFKNKADEFLIDMMQKYRAKKADYVSRTNKEPEDLSFLSQKI